MKWKNRYLIYLSLYQGALSHSSQQMLFYEWVSCHMLVVSDGSLISKSTTLLSSSQTGIPLMPGCVHQLSPDYPVTNRRTSWEVRCIWLYQFIAKTLWCWNLRSYFLLIKTRSLQTEWAYCKIWLQIAFFMWGIKNSEHRKINAFIEMEEKLTSS